MAEWLIRWCLRDMKCAVHNLEVMGLIPGWVELGVHGPSVLLEPKVLATGIMYLALFLWK